MARTLKWCDPDSGKRWVQFEQSLSDCVLGGSPWLQTEAPHQLINHQTFGVMLTLIKPLKPSTLSDSSSEGLSPVTSEPKFMPGLQDRSFFSNLRDHRPCYTFFRMATGVPGWKFRLCLNPPLALRCNWDLSLPTIGERWRCFPLLRNLKNYLWMRIQFHTASPIHTVFYPVHQTRHHLNTLLDGNMTYTLPLQRVRILQITNKAYVSCSVQETGYKILSRWYMVPKT